MKNQLVNILVLVSLLYAIFWALDYCFTSTYKKASSSKIQWLYNIEDKEYDFAVHGSSRSYTGVDVGEIENGTGYKGINIAVDGSSITDHYLILKIFLGNNNKIKRLYLQVDPWSCGSEKPADFATPKFFPYLSEEVVFNHYKDFGFKWYAYRYIPFLRYAEYNSLWGVHQYINNAYNLSPENFDKDGGRMYKNNAFKDENENELREVKFDLSNDYVYLNNIISLCKKNNIDLILFTAPISNIIINEKYNRNTLAFEELMIKKGVSYENFGHIYGNKTKFFVDPVHLNPPGVKDFSIRIRNDLAR